MTYYAPNGTEITEEMIDRWCEAYERGEFPEGEHSIGPVVMGRPPLSTDKTETLTIKLPAGMKAAFKRKAEEQGTTASAYARSIIADSLLAVG
jgi:hypothetical protein